MGALAGARVDPEVQNLDDGRGRRHKQATWAGPQSQSLAHCDATIRTPQWPYRVLWQGNVRL